MGSTAQLNRNLTSKFDYDPTKCDADYNEPAKEIMMKNFILAALLLFLAPSIMLPEATAWNPDQAHSEVGFSVLHMSLSNVRGHFGAVTGDVHFDQADVSNSAVNVTIDMNGLDTGESARDTVLKSSSFFDVEKYPAATFTSTKVEKTPAGIAITGNLTLRGVTKPIVLTVDGPNGPTPGMDHKLHAGFSAVSSINRKDFGIGSSFPSGVVGDQVKISIDIEIIKQ